jgi:glycine/D-amino acid oxidase-like deaminating enzyme
MQSWRVNMPTCMFLKSEGCASSLSDPAGSYTLKAHCREHGLRYGDYGVPVPLEVFHDYGLAFQQRFVPDVEDTQVVGLDRSSDGYELRTATGEVLTARSVVLAVGISHFAHLPRSWVACRVSLSRTPLTIATSAPSPVATSRSSVEGSRRSRRRRWRTSRGPTSVSWCASPASSGMPTRRSGPVPWRGGCATR